MLMIMIFLGYKMFTHWRYSWVKCHLYHPTKIKWKYKTNEKWKMNIKHGVLNNLYKIINLQLHKNTLMNQMHVHGSWNLS
jgi:hypothetical protein